MTSLATSPVASVPGSGRCVAVGLSDRPAAACSGWPVSDHQRGTPMTVTSTTRPPRTLPLVDLDDARRGAPERLVAFRRLRSAAHELGFFYVVGPGIRAVGPGQFPHGLRPVLRAARRGEGRGFQPALAAFRGWTRVATEHTAGAPDLRAARRARNASPSLRTNASRTARSSPSADGSSCVTSPRDADRGLWGRDPRSRSSARSCPSLERRQGRRPVPPLAMEANMGASQQSDRQDLERRVRVDLPRVLPEEMGTTQYVEPSPDPQEGRDANSEFMLRNAGVLWP